METFTPLWKEEKRKNKETQWIIESPYLKNAWRDLVKIWNVTLANTSMARNHLVSSRHHAVSYTITAFPVNILTGVVCQLLGLCLDCGNKSACKNYAGMHFASNSIQNVSHCRNWSHIIQNPGEIKHWQILQNFCQKGNPATFSCVLTHDDSPLKCLLLLKVYGTNVSLYQRLSIVHYFIPNMHMYDNGANRSFHGYWLSIVVTIVDYWLLYRYNWNRTPFMYISTAVKYKQY